MESSSWEGLPKKGAGNLHLKRDKKSANLMKFGQNLQFLTFVTFVAEISNKNFCKLDKIQRNFCS